MATHDEDLQEPVAIPVGAMSVLEDVLHQIEEIVASARSMPLSSSALVNRQDVLDLLETLKRSLPEEISRARTILRDAEDVAQQGREQAARMIAEAKSERERLVAKTEVMEVAAREAERVLAQADAHAKRIRNEAERYVEGKLATFEVVLQKTLATVERGRARLEGRGQADELSPDELE